MAGRSRAGWGGLEVKNIREWLYLDRTEITDLLKKCLYLDAVPILIGRRIPYVTRRILKPCGALVWETYNQRYPVADADLAAQAKVGLGARHGLGLQQADPLGALRIRRRRIRGPGALHGLARPTGGGAGRRALTLQKG